MIIKNCVVLVSLRFHFLFVFFGASRLKVLHYSKADWQQKNTDTWLSSESRHDRDEAVALVPLAAGAPAVVGGDVEVDADDAAAIFKDDGLTLIVPVLDADGSLSGPLFEEDAVSSSSK